METLLLILLVLFLLGFVPVRTRYGNTGGGFVGLLIVIILLGFLFGWFA
jgi:hypothetical protein